MQMPEDHESQISSSVVKFIDIILDLYSPVPHDIRNQMRVLQSTLLYGRSKELQDYLSSLKQKLELKEKNKHHRLLSDAGNSTSGAEKSAIRKARNPLADSDKENKFYLNNVRVNTSESLKSKENSFNVTMGDRKISAVEYLNREQEETSENKGCKTGEMPRTASRTLLKIVKKSRSSKEKEPLTARSENSVPKSLQILRQNIQDIVSLMDQNEAELGLEKAIKTFSFQ